MRRMSLDLRRRRNPEATRLDGFSTQGMRTTRTAAGFGPKRITVSQVLKRGPRQGSTDSDEEDRAGRETVGPQRKSVQKGAAV